MAQVGLAQVWPSWQARAHPKRDTGSGRQASGSRAVLPLARPSRQPSPPPDSATSAPHAPYRRAGRRRRTVPLVPRATRTAHDSDGTAKWHRWAWRKFGRQSKRGRTPRGTQAYGGRRLGAGPCCHSPVPANRRRRRTVPLVPRATRPAQDAAGIAEWHRWAWRKFGRPGKRGRTPRGTQAYGGRRLGAGPCCHSPVPANRRLRTVPLVSRTRQADSAPDRTVPPVPRDSATSAPRYWWHCPVGGRKCHECRWPHPRPRYSTHTPA